jgi:hypothetical protein
VAGGQLVAVRPVTLDHTLERTQATDGSPAHRNSQDTVSLMLVAP